MLKERFWNKVNKSAPNGCWEWLGTTNGKKGYGMFSCRGLGYREKQLAHRLSYMHHKGRIPEGLFVLHECDNPKCVNPDHLWVGTNRDNVLDMISKGRDVRNPVKGESHPFRLLSEGLVISMRRDFCRGDTIETIAKRYKVGKAGASDAIRGRSWKHILGKNGSPTLDDIKAAAQLGKKSNAKITASDVREIRGRLERGETSRSIAKDYGIHAATVSDIKARRIWKDA